jgi:hypothetical protein
VDVRELATAPGVVRTTTIHRGNGVTIEFDRSRAYFEGDIEGWGPKYIATYASLDDLVSDLEDFLGEKIVAWKNYTAEPLVPSTLDEPGPSAQEHFEDLVRRAAVELPRMGSFHIANTYWRHVGQYGEFREDKVFEEQEEHLRLEEET